MGNCNGTINVNFDSEDHLRLVLVGNPNVGKSVFFNALTGLYVDVSNFPGTTVDISRGKFDDYIVEDTPGVYGVSSFNDEETVARDIIINADVILNVVDAVHLHRDLFLTQQLIDMGKKIVVALNMMDEAKRSGIKIDIQKLSKSLGVPVIPTIALKNQGLEDVKRQIRMVKPQSQATKLSIQNTKIQLQDSKPSLPNQNLNIRTKDIDTLLKLYIDKGISEPDSLLILEDDQFICERNKVTQGGMRETVYKMRRTHIENILDQTITQTNVGTSFGTIIGRAMIRPITGIPLLIACLWLIFEFIGVFVGQTIVGITQEQIMGGIYQPAVVSFSEQWIPLKSFFGEVLIGEFGLLTMTPVYVLGLLLPLVVGFYLVLSILEDSGYLPRIATLTDRLLTGVGLNGRAIIPTILAFGCFTAATMTTRLLGSKRERIIATALLGLTIPCSAQIGVVAGKLAALGAGYTAFYTIVLIIIFGIIGKLLNILLPGESTDLLIDLPPIRMPRITNVFMKTFTKAKMFLMEATPLFALGALIISVMNYTGFLTLIQNSIEPLTVSWLMLPKESATIFIMGIVRRDFGAAGLSNLMLTNDQMIVSLLTITLFVPCIAAIIVIFKERSKLEATLIWGGSMFIAFFVGGILSRVLTLI